MGDGGPVGTAPAVNNGAERWTRGLEVKLEARDQRPEEDQPQHGQGQTRNWVRRRVAVCVCVRACVSTMVLACVNV